MPIDYRYNPTENVVHTIPSGEITTSTISAYYQTLLKDSDTQNDFVDLISFDTAIEFNFSADQAIDLDLAIKDLIDAKQYHGVVFICRSDLEYGIARMPSSLFEDLLPALVTRSEAEGLKAIHSLRLPHSTGQ